MVFSVSVRWSLVQRNRILPRTRDTNCAINVTAIRQTLRQIASTWIARGLHVETRVAETHVRSRTRTGTRTCTLLCARAHVLMLQPCLLLCSSGACSGQAKYLADHFLNDWKHMVSILSSNGEDSLVTSQRTSARRPIFGLEMQLSCAFHSQIQSVSAHFANRATLNSATDSNQFLPQI